MALATRPHGTRRVQALNSLATQLNHLLRNEAGKEVSVMDGYSKYAAGFFKLPIEIRNAIYKLLLFPQSESDTINKSMGSTKILQVCQQAYVEGCALLYSGVEFQIDLVVKANAIFRNPFAFGKPNLFRGSVRTSYCFIYPDFCELQVVRFEHLELRFCLSNLVYGTGSQQWKNLKHHVSDLNKALRKSKSMKSVKINLIIDAGFFQFNDNTLGTLMLQVLRPLIFTAKSKGFALFFNNTGEDNILTDYLVETANRQILSQGATLDARAQLWKTINQSIDQQDSDPNRLAQYVPDQTVTTYKFTPECRRCLAVFDSLSALRKHLFRNPKHRQPFRKKQYNQITPFAAIGGQRKCWTCARNYVSINKLDEHLDREGHRRHGIIPRWVQDNEKWDGLWAGWQGKHGWL